MPDTRFADISYYADPAKYPSFREVWDTLTISGILSGVPDDRKTAMQERVQQAIVEAAEEWEQVVDWRPFLSTGVVEARTFDGTGAEVLPFDAGLLSLTSVAIGGATYTPGQSLALGPENADAKGRPFTFLDFGRWGSAGLQSGYANPYADFYALSPIGLRSVSVTGVWGYCAKLPSDVRRLILYRAAETLYPLLIMARSGAVAQATNADGSTIKFRGTESNPFFAAANGFSAAASRYRRLVM